MMTNSSIFTPNMRLPVHRWFRYSAGFSAAWVEQAVRSQSRRNRLNVLDPFAGSGTTLLAARMTGVDSIGIESHPFVARIAQTKLRAWSSADEFEERAAAVLADSKPLEWVDPPTLMAKIYSPHALAKLRGLRCAIERLGNDDAVDTLLWLALVGVLRVCSPVGTAQWQYVLPNKTKARTAEPLSAFAAQVALMASDMRAVGVEPDVLATLYEEDARVMASVPDEWADLVITSPPYPNNYDYADATRIEMTFFEEVAGWGDLQGRVRSRLVRSCSQHMVRFDPAPVLNSPDVAPIQVELRQVFERLAEERQNHSGKKNYHTMVVAYFADLSKIFQALRRVCAVGSEMLFIIGDSAPYGVYVPVDRWLGELALDAGFESYDFTKLRDRNLKWKNRKHRVPLHEGILRVRG
jgi:hypothetical protein